MTARLIGAPHLSACRVEFLFESFHRDVKCLEKKYRSVKSTLSEALSQLQKTPGLGDAIPLGIGSYPGQVYKLRLAGEGRGKSGGYRLIYYHCEFLLVPLFLYSKGDAEDIPCRQIRRALTEILPNSERSLTESHND